MKIWVRGLLLGLFLMVTLAPCYAAQPQRVAILPVVFRAGPSDAAVGLVIEQTLAAKFHTPLPGLVPVYSVIDPGEMAPVLAAIWPDSSQPRLDQAALTNIAEQLRADIVVAAEVNDFYTHTYMWKEGDWYRQTVLAIRLVSYHAPSGQYFAKSGRENYSGDDILWGQPDYIARQLMDGLLAKLPKYQ